MATNVTTTSSTLANAFSGASGGLDVNTLVTKLMAAEHLPVDALTAKQASYQAKITALGTFNSKVSALQAAAQKLGSSSASSLSAFTATSSNTSIFSASASSTAIAGTYSLTVTSLAQSQNMVAAGQTSTTAAIGTGTSTTLNFGTGKSVVIDGTNNTLQGINDAINAANIGISATIVNDGSGTPYRLALTSTASGVSNGFTITASPGGDAAVSNLMTTMTQTVAAQDAAFTVNGIAITSASNTPTSAIQGVTLTLSNITATPVTLNVARDTTAVTQAVTDFVSKYNELASALKNTFAYKSGSALAGDSTLNSLRSEMQNIVSTATSSGTLTHLFDVGITSTTTGTLQLDSTKLSSAMSTNFNDVATLFNSTTGYGTRFDQWSTSVLSVDGSLAHRTSSYNTSIQTLADRISAQESRLKLVESNYRQQFSALNVAMLGMTQTSTYLSQQLK